MNTLWIRLSNIGISSSMPIESSRKIILTNQIAYIAFIVIFSMNASFAFNPAIDFNIISLLTSFVILINPLLNRYGQYKISAFSFSILMPIATLVFSSLSKIEIEPPIPLMVYIFPKILLLSFLVLPLILIDSKNRSLLITAIVINLTCIFLLEQVNEWMGVGIDISRVSMDNYDRINSLIIFPIAVILIGFVFLNRINNKYEETIIKQNLKLEKAYSKIEKINQDLTDSIEYAESIQNALLPDLNVLDNYFNDPFVYYKAKSIVSGDFYFVKETSFDHEKCLIIAAADCTGHGVPGGFMSMLAMSLLNEITRENHFTNAADILNQLRESIKTTLNQTGKEREQKDGLEMALIIYCPTLKTIQFAGAKNPLYIISNKELNLIKGDRMPIGIHFYEEPFTNHQISLKPNDMCYMFSDGITDQMNYKGKKFMSNNLKKLLLENHHESGNKQRKVLSHKLNAWMKRDDNKCVEQIDDMLMIGFRIKA